MKLYGIFFWKIAILNCNSDSKNLQRFEVAVEPFFRDISQTYNYKV